METIEVTVKLPADMVNSFFSLLSDLKNYKNNIYSQPANSQSSQPTGDVISEPSSVIEESRESKENRKEKAERREKPASKEELGEYIKEKGLTISPDKFWDYYEKRGWKDGKGELIQDWQAIADSWDKREWHRKKSTVADFRPRIVDDTDKMFERRMRNVFLSESGTGNQEELATDGVQ